MTFDADGKLSTNTDVPNEPDDIPSGYYFDWANESLSYDGNGHVIIRSQSGQQCSPTYCYSTFTRKTSSIHSSLLDQDIAEVIDDGGASFNRRYVFLNGVRISKREVYPGVNGFESTGLTSREPSGATITLMSLGVSSASNEQADVLGAGVGSSDTYPVAPQGGWPDPNDPNCVWNDYDDFECDMSGSGYQDPEDMENALGSVMDNTYYVDGREANIHDAEHLIAIGAVEVVSTTGRGGSDFILNPIFGHRTIGNDLADGPNGAIRIQTIDQEYIAGWEKDVVNGSGAEQQHTSDELVTAVMTKFGQSMEDCLKKLYKKWLAYNVNSPSKRGPLLKKADTIKVDKVEWGFPVDATLSSSSAWKRAGGQGPAPYSLADPGRYYHSSYTVVIGQENWNNEGEWREGTHPELVGRTGVENSYVWEWGNLASAFLTGSGYSFGKNTSKNPYHEDSGAPFSKCVWASINRAK